MTFQDSLRRAYIYTYDICLGLTKSKERIQTMLNYIIFLHQNSKLQMQPQEVYGSDLSLSKATSCNIVFSADLAPDLSACIDTVQGIARVFCETSNIGPHTSNLWNKLGFLTSLSCDIEPDITKPTSNKIFVSADLDPDLSEGLNSGRVIYWFFHEPFLWQCGPLFWKSWRRTRN